VVDGQSRLVPGAKVDARESVPSSPVAEREPRGAGAGAAGSR
jgi:hypothetical protein